MHLNSEHLQKLYDACSHTHLLWTGTPVFDIEQFDVPLAPSSNFKRPLHASLRLGQLAEQFVFNQLEATEQIELLAENIQIQEGKQTLGELDTLILARHQPIHLEIVYKFYLYDDTLGNSDIEQWIGPNRNDSLLEKLQKLKAKQLPLLYNEACQATLHHMQMDSLNFTQRVLFKAQLYVPYQKTVNFIQLNSACVSGFYIHLKDLEHFKPYKFYIPNKLDWFLSPHTAVDWMDYDAFITQAQLLLNLQKSPLFWVKNETSKLEKGFLVWW